MDLKNAKEVLQVAADAFNNRKIVEICIPEAIGQVVADVAQARISSSEQARASSQKLTLDIVQQHFLKSDKSELLLFICYLMEFVMMEEALWRKVHEDAERN